MVEWTRGMRKFDDIWYSIERFVYLNNQLSGFTSEQIYESLRDKSFFNSAEDFHHFLIENGRKFRLKVAENGGWERYW